MKYIGNPIEVDAFKITKVGSRDFAGLIVKIDDGSDRLVTPEQMARYEPTIGDYFVIQSDGYIYINPKAVFERKYSRDDKSNMPFERRQNMFSAWVQQVLTSLAGTNLVPAGPVPYWLLNIGAQSFFPCYGQYGIRGLSVSYIFRTGNKERPPKVLDGGDLGLGDGPDKIRVHELEEGWKYAAIGFSAEEENSGEFEEIVLTRVALAVSKMHTQTYEVNHGAITG